MATTSTQKAAGSSDRLPNPPPPAAGPGHCEVTSTAGSIAKQIEMSVPGMTDVKDLRRLTGGSSHETWSFNARLTGGSDDTFTPFILRREFEQALFDMSLATEFELLRRLHSVGMPVPRPYFVSIGMGEANEPFMVMERVAGLDTRKAMAADSNPGGRHAIGVALVNALAMLHSQPTEPLRDLLGDSAVLVELERWRGIVLGSGYSSAALLLALSWLEANCLAEVEPVIVHGDFKANNILLQDGTRPVIIDWELAHVGERLEDLAWTMLWSTPEDLVGGMLTPKEFIAEYERLSGTVVDPGRLQFWKVFSLVKLAAIFLKGIQAGPHGRPPRPQLLMLAQALPCIEQALAALLCRVAEQGITP